MQSKGATIRQALDELNKLYPNTKIRSKGMMLAMEFESAAIAKQITSKCFEAGLIIGACSTGEIIKFIPPLTIEEATLKKGLDIFTSAVKSVLG